ncbi:MAG TPA: hypothetical protein VFA41_15435 [Ktedonobacteraceae bacterium]|jgi:hypothetical protein|nr:hypothetical protein [Ktedonobacteraceae bacterium]
MEQEQPPERPLVDDERLDNLLAMGENEFQAAFGEAVEKTLDLDTWHTGEDLAAMYQALEQEVANAVVQEGRIRERIRSDLFPLAFRHPQAPKDCAGNYQVDVHMLERIHRGLLFNGNVEACDGTSMVHDSLPVTIAQIGVSLVSYHGDQGTYVHRLYRRDLRVGGSDPVEEAMKLLEKRKQRDSTDASSTRDKLSDFTQRGIMAYAERAVLLEKSQARWRMGHGHPVPYELLTGGGLTINGDMPLLRYSINMWRKLLLEHKRWVFVTSAPADRLLLTLGDALYPLEFALVATPLQSMRDITRGNLPSGKGLKEEAQKFVEELGPQIVIGLYRASAQAPVRLFYAHREFACEAALIAMADSVLQEHRGFPMLIDLADAVCRATFGGETFRSMVQQAYAGAGEPFRYLGERETRN